jgi:hypothetical protein
MIVKALSRMKISKPRLIELLIFLGVTTVSSYPSFMLGSFIAGLVSAGEPLYVYEFWRVFFILAFGSIAPVYFTIHLIKSGREGVLPIFSSIAMTLTVAVLLTASRIWWLFPEAWIETARTILLILMFLGFTTPSGFLTGSIMLSGYLFSKRGGWRFDWRQIHRLLKAAAPAVAVTLAILAALNILIGISAAILSPPGTTPPDMEECGLRLCGILYVNSTGLYGITYHRILAKDLEGKVDCYWIMKAPPNHATILLYLDGEWSFKHASFISGTYYRKSHYTVDKRLYGVGLKYKWFGKCPSIDGETHDVTALDSYSPPHLLLYPPRSITEEYVVLYAEPISEGLQLEVSFRWVFYALVI